MKTRLISRTKTVEAESVENWPAWFMALSVLVLTSLTAYGVSLRERAFVEDEFKDNCNRIVRRIESRIQNHAQILRGGVAFFETREHVTRKEWKTYVENLELPEWHPGILGTGFAQVIERQRLPEHLQQTREEGFPEYRVWPETTTGRLSTILYLEPFSTTNQRAFGYDMLSEPVRRAAMQRACDTNSVALSGKVLLVQENGDEPQAGTLMYAPVYHSDMPIRTIQERRTALKGWVYSPYRMRDLMEGILGANQDHVLAHVTLNIHDGDSVTPDSLLYAHPQDAEQASAALAQIPLVAAGRTWTLSFHPASGTAPFLFTSRVSLTMISGIAISILIFLLSNLLGQTRSQLLELKSTRAELASSEDRFELAMLGSKDGLWDWNLPANEIYYSPRWIEMLGYTESELECRPETTLELMHPADREKYQEYLTRYIEGRAEAFECEIRMRHKEGRYLNVLSRAFAIRNLRDDSATRLVGTHVDLTESKAREVTLAHFKSSLDRIQDCVFMFDPESLKFIYCNQGAVDQLGYSHDELKAMTPLDIKPEFDAEQFRKMISPMIAGTRSSHVFETVYRHRDGRHIPVEISLQYVTHESASPRFVKIVRDITEQKKSKERLESLNSELEQRIERRTKELRQSESRFRSAMENSAIGMALIDPEGRWLDVNKALCQLVGYTENELVNRSYKEITHPDDLERNLNRAEQLLAGEIKTFQIEKRYFHKLGHIVWIMANVSLVRDEDGTPKYFIAQIQDISEKIATRQQLLENNRFNRLLFENMTEAVVACDAKGKLKLFNKVFREWHGLDAELIPQNQMSQHHDPFQEDGRTPLAAEKIPLMRAFHGEEVRDVAISIKTKDQNPRQVLCHGGPIYDESGSRQGAIIVMHDITERKNAEGAVKRSRRRFRRLFEYSPDAIVMTNQAGTIVLANRQVKSKFGWDTSDLIGTSLIELLPPDLQARFAKLQERYLQKPKPLSLNADTSGMRCCRRKEGEFPADVSLTPLETSEGYMIAIAIRDVSERQRTLEKLKQTAKKLKYANSEVEKQRQFLADRVAERTAELTQANAELQRASEAKNTFLATMSHELRTPLNGVIGMTDLLAGTQLDEKQQQFVEACRNSGESLLQLINDVLDFSKIEAGMLEVDLLDFNLEDLVMDIVETMTWRTVDKNLELPCFIDPTARLILKGDRNRLRQVLVNLMGNAIKFTEEGEIVVSAETISKQNGTISIRFSVRDTGIGIPADKLDRLFQSFSQVDASTTREYGGTGLGLVISQSLVGLMGGVIGVNSEAGFGSTFWFDLDFEVVSEPDHDKDGTDRLKDRRLLIVDDNETNRMVLTGYTAEWGGQSIAVSNVADAFAAIEQADREEQPFDIVLTDFNMPEQTGLDLAQALQDRPQLVVGILGSTDLQLNPQSMKKRGVSAVVQKPLRRNELYHVICGVLKPVKMLPREPKSIPRPEPSIPFPPSHLLLAEDNNINQMFVVEMLKKYSCTCDTVGNGQEAIDAVQTTRYDLVLMDCQMPVMDGFDATHYIRQLESDGVIETPLPIVALTANAIKGDRERCLAAGMDDYLSKPVSLEQLRDVLARYLMKSSPQVETDAPTGEERESSTPGVPKSTPPIDAKSLWGRCFNNLEFAESLLNELTTSGPQKLAEIKQQAIETDAKELANTAHALKGAAGIMCAETVQNLASQIEAAGRADDLRDVEHLVSELSDEMQRCLAYLPDLRQEMNTFKRSES